MHCVGLAYDVSLRQMIDNKVDSHLKGLINHYYYYYFEQKVFQILNYTLQTVKCLGKFLVILYLGKFALV